MSIVRWQMTNQCGCKNFTFRRLLTASLMAACLFVAVCLVGCESVDRESPEVAAARARYLLKEAPADPILITDARKLPAGSPMVLVGRLGVAGQPTWEAGKAMFMISDAHPQVAGHTHDEGEKESDCVFCKRSRNERLAMVQLVDEQGEIAAIDAHQLLGINDGAQVVVHGTGEVNSLDVLVVTADGIHIP